MNLYQKKIIIKDQIYKIINNIINQNKNIKLYLKNLYHYNNKILIQKMRNLI